MESTSQICLVIITVLIVFFSVDGGDEISTGAGNGYDITTTPQQCNDCSICPTVCTNPPPPPPLVLCPPPPPPPKNKENSAPPSTVICCGQNMLPPPPPVIAGFYPYNNISGSDVRLMLGSGRLRLVFLLLVSMVW